MRKLILLFALTSQLQAAPTIRAILDAKSPLARQQAITAYLKLHPAAKKILTPSEQRPETTPGNEHGKRPVTPPGINNYGTP